MNVNNINILKAIIFNFIGLSMILFVINNNINKNINKDNANNARYMYQIGWNKGLKAGLMFDEANGDTLINFWKRDSICAERYIRNYKE